MLRSWDHLRFALAVHRNRSLAGAARALGVELSTVMRRLAALEEEVGTALFLRARRAIVPTEAGRALVAVAEQVEAEMQALERRLAKDIDDCGPVRLATTDGLAERLLVDGNQLLRSRLNGIELEIIAANATVDLGAREADLALRLARPSDASLICKRVASFSYALYASRSYIERHGAPGRDDLRGHSLVVGTRELGASPEWQWMEEWIPRASSVLRTNSSIAARVAIETGFGVGVLPRIAADASSLLVLLAQLPEIPRRHAWLVLHRDGKTRRVKRVAAAIEEALKLRSAFH
jgi:DNA-binding transcriptional LysR family regulator